MQYQYSHGRLQLTAFIFIGLLLIGAMLPFWPAISGGFWFDDISTLQRLGLNPAGVHDYNSFMNYVFGGTSSPIGRPISLLSFLLDGQNWPTDAAPFKYSNIMFHSLNGLLFFGFLFYLLQAIGQTRPQALTIAFLAAILWTIHPIQVSTVAYVVQRMTELSALFMILSLWCYVHGRRKLQHQPTAAYYWMTLGMGAFGVLSLLSKENGLLIPLLILVMEATLLQRLPRPTHWKYWAIPVLGLPVLVLMSYLLLVTINHTTYYANRDFDLYERLMTESRIIFNYLGMVLWPTSTPTLFYDDQTISKSLFQPFTTLVSIITLLAATAWAWWARRRLPIISFAILWYLGAQVLESTVIQLELYFEHRNYIPLLGPALAAAYYLHQFIQRQSKLGLAAVTALLSVMTIQTWHHSTTWGHSHLLAQKWVEESPRSIRAHLTLSTYEIRENMPALALQSAIPALEIDKQHLGAQLHYVGVACINNALKKEEYVAILEDVKHKAFDTETFPALARLYDLIVKGSCRQVSLVGLLKIIDGLLENPTTHKRDWAVSNIYRMKSATSQLLQLFDPTVNALEKAFELTPHVSILIRMATLNASVGRLEIAEKYLDSAYTLDDLRPRFSPSSRAEIDELKAYIESLKQ